MPSIHIFRDFVIHKVSRLFRSRLERLEEQLEKHHAFHMALMVKLAKYEEALMHAERMGFKIDDDFVGSLTNTINEHTLLLIKPLQREIAILRMQREARELMALLNHAE